MKISVSGFTEEATKTHLSTIRKECNLVLLVSRQNERTVFFALHKIGTLVELPVLGSL